RELSVPMNLGYELKAIVPIGFAAGQHQLKVVNLTGTTGIYGTLIKITDERYEGVIVGQSTSPVTLLPGEKTEAWVKIKNLSNYTWVRDGSNQVQLGVPEDQKSLFYDPATWILNYRAARMEESSVAYGQIGTFRFYIKAPTQIGEYTDGFGLVLEHIKWLNMPTISWTVKVKSEVTPPTTGGVEYYADRLVKQSSQRIELTPGQEATLWVDFENTGTITWTADGKYPVRIGTEQRRDRVSRLRGKNWVLRDRPSNVESVTPPGAVGRFSINIKAPSRIGTYKEYFGLVAEHKTWISGDLVYWEIVVARSAKKSATVKTPPPTTGGVPLWTPSNQVTLFVDGTESLFNKIAQGVSDLWNTLTTLFSWR
ncbi:hypothetical protein JXA59_02995, partial [Patescibacteria group bacterium]|nr:hypothetical protein [Patescibacteria group bacterium]